MARNREKNYISNYENTGSRRKNDSAMELRRQSFGKNLSFAASEAYKLLRTNLMFSMPDENECKVIGVTSALRGEGKSTTALNLAYSLAENGKKTLLVEADMRIPVVASVLKIEAVPGLSHVLAGRGELNDAARRTDFSKNLYVLPAGEIPPNPAELLSSRRMQLVVETLRKAFEYIIIDLPPISAVSDGLAVSKLLSGMVVVVRQNYCDQHSLFETMRQLEFLKVKLLGFVFNGADTQSKRYKKYGGKYKKHYYSYGYGHGGKSKTEGRFDAENVSDDIVFRGDITFDDK